MTIQLRDASKFARVHVFATRYQPAFDAFANLSRVRDAELGGVIPGHAESVYLTGRNIGDEYRYVLDRKGQRKFPGNMLERPKLLLNPWAVRTTETGEQTRRGGDDFAGRRAVRRRRRRSRPADARAGRRRGRSPASRRLRQPRLPGRRVGGRAEPASRTRTASIKLTAQGPRAARDDPRRRRRPARHDVAHRHAAARQPATFVDLRLKDGLDPARHFTQQKQVTRAAEGASRSCSPTSSGSRFEAYDSLAKVYALYATLSKDPKLAEFAFVLTWPKLKPEEKRTLYSKYACHELNFFLSKKDPEFFAEVVKPYLANKKDKTFLDHWLLGDDLTRYLQPWEYGRLNTVERVLLAQRIAGRAGEDRPAPRRPAAAAAAEHRPAAVPVQRRRRVRRAGQRRRRRRPDSCEVDELEASSRS